MDYILSQLPSTTSRPDKSQSFIHYVPPIVYAVVVGLPLFIIIHDAIMNLFTKWALKWPRFILTLSIVLVTTSSILLFDVARGLHPSPAFQTVENYSWVCLGIKWLMIYGSSSLILFPFFILPPRSTAPSPTSNKLSSYEDEDFRLKSVIYKIFYILLVVFNLAITLSIVLLFIKQSNEYPNLSVITSFTSLVAAAAYWSITGFFLHIFQLNAITPGKDLVSMYNLADEKSERYRNSISIDHVDNLEKYLAEFFSFHKPSSKCKGTHSNWYYCKKCKKSKIVETGTYYVIYFLLLFLIALLTVGMYGYFLLTDITSRRYYSVVGFAAALTVQIIGYIVLARLIWTHIRRRANRSAENVGSDRSLDHNPTSPIKSPKSQSLVSLNMNSPSVSNLVEASTDNLVPKSATFRCQPSRLGGKEPTKPVDEKSQTAVTKTISRSTSKGSFKEATISENNEESQRVKILDSKSLGDESLRHKPPVTSPVQSETKSTKSATTKTNESIKTRPKTTFEQANAMQDEFDSISFELQSLASQLQSPIGTKSSNTIAKRNMIKSEYIPSSKETDERPKFTETALIAPATILKLMTWLQGPKCLNSTQQLFQIDTLQNQQAPELLKIFQRFLQKYGKSVFVHLTKHVSSANGDDVTCPSKFDPLKSQYYGTDGSQREFKEAYAKKFGQEVEWDESFASLEDVKKCVKCLSGLIN